LEEEINEIKAQLEWLCGMKFKYNGKFLLKWHCRHRMLKFIGISGGLASAGIVTVFFCSKCGLVLIENTSILGTVRECHYL
jgi:hypothetical protein